MREITIPVWEKVCMTVEEAAVYSNIGENKLRSLIKDRDCGFALRVGTKVLIKKRQFLDYLDQISAL